MHKHVSCVHVYLCVRQCVCVCVCVCVGGGGGKCRLQLLRAHAVRSYMLESECVCVACMLALCGYECKREWNRLNLNQISMQAN